MTQRFRQRGPDYWTPLVRLIEAITMLDMARTDEGKAISEALWPIREDLLRLAQHPGRSRRQPTAKGDPT